MNEIEVGEYIRTKAGYIYQIRKIEKPISAIGRTVYWVKEFYLLKEDIKAHSKNIIDLIEAEDIVCIKDRLYDNEYKLEVFEDYKNRLCIDSFEEDKTLELRKNIQDKQIRLISILTHEMYEQNCYKVGDRESEADKMFEELGYQIYSENDETLIYKKKSDFFEVSITFDKRDFMQTFHGVEGRWVANNSATWVTQKFKNEFDKYSSANGYWSSIWHEFTIEELKAINKKVEELGWN